MADIRDVQQRHQDAIMRLPNVVGVGIGEKAGRAILKVFVSRKLPETQLAPEDIVPSEIEGYETDVEEIGDIEAQP
jgi:hypothetical protein